MYRRYAVFFTPPAGGLADFTASWLGWDSASGKAVAHPDLVPIDVSSITNTPRKYGFHGTLRAPFRLQNGVSQRNLENELGRFANRHSPVALQGLELADDHGFVHLGPLGDATGLNTLAAEIVRAFDPLRAPLNEAEMARRLKSPLSEKQRGYLDDWGYPYVMDEFRYHMTLSGKLPPAQSSLVISALAPLITPLTPRPFIIDALTLLGEDSKGHFHQIHRYALTG